MTSLDWSVGPIDHIGIAVENLEGALPFYQTVLGLPLAGIEEVMDQKVKTAILPTGEARIELLESTDPEGPIGKFLAKRGPGIHHIAIRVADVRAKLAELAAQGCELIDKEPRVGAGGHLIAFVHPKSTGGVLLELTQHCHSPEVEESRH